LGSRSHPDLVGPGTPQGGPARGTHLAALVRAGGPGSGPQRPPPGGQRGPCPAAPRRLADRCQRTRSPPLGGARQLVAHRG
jgi:hypothetical protein